MRIFAAQVEHLFRDATSRGPRGAALYLLRLGYLLTRKAGLDLCLERAASLSFTTTVTFIPLTILLFGIVGSTGRLEPLLLKLEDYLVSRLVVEEAVSPVDGAERSSLQSNRETVRHNLDLFIEQLKRPLQAGSKILNPIAVLLLVVAVSSLFRSAERAFAVIWGVQVRRGFFRKIGTFWLLLTMPLLILLFAEYIKNELALGTTEGLGWIEPLFGVAITFFAFALVYHFLPNTVVRTQATAWGALFAAIGWEALMQGYAFYLQTFGSSTLYGALGVIPVVLLLIYFSWAIALGGAELSYCIQNYHLLEREIRYHISAREGAVGVQALVMLERVYLGYHGHASRPTVELLATEFDLPISVAERSIQPLLDNAMLVQGPDGSLIPAVAAPQLSLQKVLDAYPKGMSIRQSHATKAGTPLTNYLLGVGEKLDQDFAGKSFGDFLPPQSRKN